jgi:hypothetical protein
VATELRTPALDPELVARRTADQQMNINALNITMSSHFLSNVLDLKKQWTEYRQEVKKFVIHNSTGLKLRLQPEGSSHKKDVGVFE